MSIKLAIARAAQLAPHRPAIRGDGFERSWSETAARISALAGGLSSLGLQAGDRLAILAANSAEHMEITYAAIWAGVIIVPLNTRLSQQEAAEIIIDSGSTVLAHDQVFKATAHTLLNEVHGLKIRLPLDDENDPKGFHALLGSTAINPVQNTSDDILGIYYTGGTTGKPKGVELSHSTFHLTALDQAHGLQFDNTTAYLHAAPYFHLADCSVGNSVTYTQGVHIFTKAVSAEGILGSVENLGVNTLNLVPTMYQDLLEAAKDSNLLSAIDRAIYGAAPMASGTLSRMLSAFPNARFFQAYGQTEIGGACLILPPEVHTENNPRLACAGRATNSVHIRIIDEQGNEQPRGQSGEIAVAGLRVMNGYRALPEKTAETVVDGWLRTGDVGVMDEEGFVAVVDRLKDMIVSGGENVFCGEVENAISTHPAVETVSVVGIPDPRWGESVHAFIVARQGKTIVAEDIITHCRKLIAPYKCPKDITTVAELPLSPVGKVRKDLLRALKTSE